MDLISGKTEGLTQKLYSDVLRYRHEIFVERLGWQISAINGMEFDQFDRNDTVYIIAQKNETDIIGCARLLPTTSPYLLGEIFPQLLNGEPPPCSPDVWELSRFAALDITQRGTTSSHRLISTPIAVGLLQESLACASARGAKRLITVSPIGIDRLLKQLGFNSYRAGPPMKINGQTVVACWIEINVLDHDNTI